MNHQSPVSAKRAASVGAALIFALQLSLGVAFSQTQSSTPDIPVDEIIKKFSEKEKEFRQARENYAFRQDVRVQELGASDRVAGEFQRSTDIYFDEKGKRSERIVYAPAPTLKRLAISPEDEQDLRDIQPFVLTSDDIGKYNLKYGGREKVDEITAYVFDVSPKTIEKNQRYFEGKIWVDDRDFQIVKTYGKAVPDRKASGRNQSENLAPRFETYREQIDDYWFPTYTRAVDTLDFSSGAIKMRMIVRYTNYKRFQTSFKIRSVGEATEGGTAAPAEAPPADKTAPALDPKYKTDPKAAPRK